MNDELQNTMEEFDDSEMVNEIPLDLFDEDAFDEDFDIEEDLPEAGQIFEEFGDF